MSRERRRMHFSSQQAVAYCTNTGSNAVLEQQQVNYVSLLAALGSVCSHSPCDDKERNIDPRLAVSTSRRSQD